MNDREYLEKQLRDLKLRREELIIKKRIFTAEHNLYMEDIAKQIYSIELHFDNCLQND